MRHDRRPTPTEELVDELTKDELVSLLRHAPSAFVDNWVDTNVVSMVDVRRVLKRLIKILHVIHNRS